MSAEVIRLPVIRIERYPDGIADSETVFVELQGERLAKVRRVSEQLDRPVNEVVKWLLGQAVDKLSNKILSQ